MIDWMFEGFGLSQFSSYCNLNCPSFQGSWLVASFLRTGIDHSISRTTHEIPMGQFSQSSRKSSTSKERIGPQC